VALATVKAPSSFGRLKKEFLVVQVKSDSATDCGELNADQLPVDILLTAPCLMGLGAPLASAIATGERWTSRESALDLALAPGSTPVLTIKPAGVLAEAKLSSLIAQWQRQRRLSERDERAALEEAATAIGKETLSDRLVSRAIEDLLPTGPAWELLPAATRAGRLSSLLRLLAACSACSATERSAFLDQLLGPVRAKFAHSKANGTVALTNGALAYEWGRIAGWWAEELRESRVIDLALASLQGCGADAHGALLAQLGRAESLYLDQETNGELRKRIVRYTNKSTESFCGVMIAKARAENAVWRERFAEWMTAALAEGPRCGLETVLYGAAGGAP
jgi:hypothetical protein